MTRVRKTWIAAALGLVVVLVALAVGLGRSFLRGPEGHYFESAGARLHYSDEGSGEPLILIHGFAASGHLNWRLTGVIDVLSPRFRVIALDVRGHGRSARPTDPGAHGIELSEDVVRLMDHLGIERANVAGYSMGGFITLKLIASHPERILRAAACGFGWQRPDPSALDVYRLLGASFERGIGFASMVTFLNPGQGIGPIQAVFIDFVARRILDTRAVGALASSLGELTVTEAELRAVDVPVLSVFGSEDPLGAGIADLHAVLRRHEIVWIPGRSHRTTPLDPAFATALLDWFARPPDSAGLAGR